jgi:acyl-[acyl-carrier-protein]-phospholipid O-acyltransferase/long-chain-fatty-acid--[acyl-carrier-protein] ligase
MNKTLQGKLVGTSRRFGDKLALADSSGARATFSGALAKSVFLSGRLRGIWEAQEKVGLLVSPSVGGALLNWAALLMGKVPVNLNYTLSQEGIISCIEQCRITDVVVSAKLMKRLKLELPARIHVLEELDLRPRVVEKLTISFS